jgi:hypothetical protein
VPYIPAGQRAAEAIAANPQRSDRAIAAEIGVDHKTEGAARKAVGEHSPPERIGRDGKSYPTKATKPPPVVDHDDDSTTDADHEQGLRVIAARGLINRASESAAMARYPLGRLVITNEIITAARDAAQSWSDLVAKLTEAKA